MIAGSPASVVAPTFPSWSSKALRPVPRSAAFAKLSFGGVGGCRQLSVNVPPEGLSYRAPTVSTAIRYRLPAVAEKTSRLAYVVAPASGLWFDATSMPLVS